MWTKEGRLKLEWGRDFWYAVVECVIYSSREFYSIGISSGQFIIEKEETKNKSIWWNRKTLGEVGEDRRFFPLWYAKLIINSREQRRINVDLFFRLEREAVLLFVSSWAGLTETEAHNFPLHNLKPKTTRKRTPREFLLSRDIYHLSHLVHIFQYNLDILDL